MIKYYLGGLICIARMGLYTKYSIQVMRMRTKGYTGISGSTVYHNLNRMPILKHFKCFDDWSFHPEFINGRLYSIGLQKEHKVNIMDCVAHLERKRIRREQFNY